jgi:hypothetical protein
VLREESDVQERSAIREQRKWAEFEVYRPQRYWGGDGHLTRADQAMRSRGAYITAGGGKSVTGQRSNRLNHAPA